MKEAWVEQIEEYLSGKMNREEKLRFESELANNEELSSAFNLYRAIETEMCKHQPYNENELELKQSLNYLNGIYFKSDAGVKGEAGIESKTESPVIALSGSQQSAASGRVRKLQAWRTIAVAASVLGVILLAVTWYLLSDKSVKNDTRIVNEVRKTDTLKSPVISDTGISREKVPEESVAKSKSKNNQPVTTRRIDNARLFADNFSPDKSVVLSSGAYKEAIDYYNKDDIENAKENFNEVNGILESETRDQGGNKGNINPFYGSYYPGLIYLASDSTSKAIRQLNKAIANSPDNSSRLKAQWYLALAYVKANELKKAEKLLKEIASNDDAGSYKQKALTLYQELRKSN